MKTNLILGSFLALITVARSQNVFPTAAGTNAGIGTTSPAYRLDIQLPSIDLNNGIRIKHNGPNSCHINFLTSGVGAGNFMVGVTGTNQTEGNGRFVIHDANVSQTRFLVDPNGNIGMGTNTPGSRLHLSTLTSGDDGINIDQLGSGGAGVYLNRSNGGTPMNWALVASGGNFKIKINTAQVYDINNFGNTGIGLSSGTYRMEMLTQNNYVDDGIKITTPTSGAGAPSLFLHYTVGGKNWALQSYSGGGFGIKNITDNVSALAITSNGQVSIGGSTFANTMLYSYASTASLGIFGRVNNVSGNIYGVRGQTNSSSNASGESVGLVGSGEGGQNNYGGKFFGWAAASCPSGVTSYGIYATVINSCTNDLAGLFDGNVKVNGVTSSTSYLTTSDKKLKKDIQPLLNGIEKIRLLKPSTYTFRTEEFKEMNLPKEQQMGLIAQELEQVFPELVSVVAGHVKTNSEGVIVAKVEEHKAINYIGLIPILISAFQNQDNTIQLLKSQLDEQKQLINELKSGTATGINNANNVETGFQMSQNEPNPFTHETVVKYTLPQSVSNAFMAVYDLTGKQITTFPIDLKGSSSLTITSEKLAAGIYIYSIVADGKVVDSKRMIVSEK